MAIVTADAMNISSIASITSRVTAITKSSATTLAHAVKTGRAYRVAQHTSTVANGHASAALRAVRMQKVSIASTSQATVSGRSYRIETVWSSPSAYATSIVNAWKYKTARSDIAASGTLEAYQTDRDIAQDVVDYLPQYYEKFLAVMDSARTEGNESTRMQAKLRELLDQFFTLTATISLDRWESLTGIEHLPQRSVISTQHYVTSKIAGTGTVNLALLNDIVNTFYGIESTELATENIMHFKFVGQRGVPKNLEDIEDAVNDVIPAHIAAEYEFTYLPWDELGASDMQWQDADTYTWDGIEQVFLGEGEFV
jgi:hypothetical protein